MNFKSKEFELGQSPVFVIRIAKSLDKATAIVCCLEDIRYQLLKRLSESLHQAVLYLMNGIWEAGDMPSILKLVNVIPIPFIIHMSSDVLQGSL